MWWFWWRNASAYIGAETKWMTISRRNLQMHFLERISITISLTFVPKGPIDDIPTLVQTMARHRPGDNPLSEPMTVSLLTHICTNQPQWVNLCLSKHRYIPYYFSSLGWRIYLKSFFRKQATSLSCKSNAMAVGDARHHPPYLNSLYRIH